MWNSNGVYTTNIDEVEHFLNSGFPQLSLWCSLGNYQCKHTAVTPWPLRHALKLKGTVPCTGLLSHRRNSRYDKQSSFRWFETWKPSCGVTAMKYVCCRYVIRMIYSVIRMRIPVYPGMLSVCLNQIKPLSFQWLYMSTITSCITGDTTACSCASAAWQQKKSQSSNYCQCLGVSTDDWWFLSTKDRRCGKCLRVMTPLTHLPLNKMVAILADVNFKCIFLNENCRIPIRI